MMDGDRAIYGGYGELWEDGEFQDHINEVTAEVTLNKVALNLTGGRWTKHKRTNISGAGTMAGYKVTSKMLQQHEAMLTDDTAVPFSTEFIVYLKDPESFGHEAVRLLNVKYDSLPITGFTAGQEVTQSTPFTFEGVELLNAIEKY